MGERIHKLEIRMTAEDVGERITVDTWLDMEEGNKRAIVTSMSQFMWLDGEPLTPDEGRAKLGALPLARFNDLCKEFFDVVRGEAVPNGNGADSGTLS